MNAERKTGSLAMWRALSGSLSPEYGGEGVKALRHPGYSPNFSSKQSLDDLGLYRYAGGLSFALRVAR
jgi:hypothetical protein